MPSSRGSSQPRDGTQVFQIAGRFFTSWATRGAQEYWSGQPIPSPGELSDPGIIPGSPALQADFFSSWATWKTWSKGSGLKKTSSVKTYSLPNPWNSWILLYMLKGVVPLTVLKEDAYPGLARWALSVFTHPFKRGVEEAWKAQRGEGSVETEAETAVLWPQAKEAWRLLTISKASESFSPRSFSGVWPWSVLIQTVASRPMRE